MKKTKNLLYVFIASILLSCNENNNNDCDLPYFVGENKMNLDLNEKAQNSLEEIMKFSNYEFTDEISKIRTEISYELTENAQFFYIQDTRLEGLYNRTYYTWILPIKSLNPEEIHFQGHDETLSLLIGNGNDDKKRFFLRVTSIKNGKISTNCETHSYTVITFKPDELRMFRKNMISFIENYNK